MRKLVGLVMLFAACGDDSPVRHLDGGMDAPVDTDAPVQEPVKVTVTFGVTPVPGVKVYFQAGDSSLIASAMTDATGVASALMPNGGFVTAVDPFASAPGGPSPEYHDLYTFAGVKPGDDLVLDASIGATTPQTFTLPIDNDAAVTSYMVSTPCGRGITDSQGSAQQPQITIDADLACASMTEIVVASLDANNQVVHWFHVADQAVTGPIDLTARTYGAPTPKSYTYNNASAVSGVGIQQSFLSQHGTVVTLPGNAFGRGSPFTGTIQTTNIAGTIDMVHSVTATSSEATHQFVDWGPFATTYSTDVAARMLPDLDGAGLDTTTHAVRWNEAAAGVTPDFALSFLEVFRARQTPQSNLVWTWSIVAPYADAAITFPALPTDIADFTIGETDEWELRGVALGKVPGGYDAVRANLFNLRGPDSLVTSAAGSVTLVDWAPRPPKARTVRGVPGDVSTVIQDRLLHPHWRK